MSEARNPQIGPPREAGPTDIHDPLIRREARKAFVWLGVAALFALAVVLSGSLMVIFGGVIPPQDFDALREAGAKAIFPPGTVIPDAAAELIKTLTQHLGHNEAA